MKRTLYLLLGTLLIVTAVEAQTTGGLRDAILSPFASHINAKVNGEELVLTWRDSEDLRSEVYHILRHTVPIDEENYFKALSLASVAPGVETFTDTPPVNREWWYAILAADKIQPYAVFIPWRNTMRNPVLVRPNSATDEENAKVLVLTAQQKEEEIRLEFSADRADRNLTVFRSPLKMDGPEVLDHAVVVASQAGSTGVLTDKPLPGVTWYYAAVDSQLFDSGDPRWMEFAAFSLPVLLPLKKSHDFVGVIRPAPLPRLRISQSFADGNPIPEIDGKLPDRRPLNASAIRTIAGILGPIHGELWEEPKPVILEVDKGFSEHRRQLILKEILEGSFAKGDWDVAETKLFALSASNGINEDLKDRIQFYRGQTLYFLNQLNDSFAAFVVASDTYYAETRRWILQIYDDLTPVS